MKGSQEVVDFVSDRLREQRQKNHINLAQICEEVKKVRSRQKGLLDLLQLLITGLSFPRHENNALWKDNVSRNRKNTKMCNCFGGLYVK